MIDTDPNVAVQILSQPVMSLMRQQKLHNWSLVGTELVYVEHPIFSRVKPDDVIEALGKLTGLVSALPTHNPAPPPQPPAQQHPPQAGYPAQPGYPPHPGYQPRYPPPQYQQPQYQQPQYQQPQYQQPQYGYPPQQGYPPPGHPPQRGY
jgi:hypothetical protein